MKKKLRSKRFFIAITMTAFLSFVTVISVFKNTEIIGSTAIAGIMTITTGYLFAQTKRASEFNVKDYANQYNQQVKGDL